MCCVRVRVCHVRMRVRVRHGVKGKVRVMRVRVVRLESRLGSGLRLRLGRVLGRSRCWLGLGSIMVRQGAG